MPEGHFDADEPLAIPVCPGEIGEPFDFAIALAPPRRPTRVAGDVAPLTKMSKYTLFSLAAMFLVFAIWALFGFSYPSYPIPFALNAVSKILSFVAAVTLFLPQKGIITK
jgi:hypothetical protein